MSVVFGEMGYTDEELENILKLNGWSLQKITYLLWCYDQS